MNELYSNNTSLSKYIRDYKKKKQKVPEIYKSTLNRMNTFWYCYHCLMAYQTLWVI